jgi:hypothetical protein
LVNSGRGGKPAQGLVEGAGAACDLGIGVGGWAEGTAGGFEVAVVVGEVGGVEGDAHCFADGFGDGGEGDEPDAVWEGVACLGGGLEGEAGIGGEEGLDVGEFRLAADQGGRLGGEVVTDAVEGFQGREVVLQPGGVELVEVLVLEEVAEGGFGREREAEAVGNGLGEQDLTAVAGGEQTGEAVEAGGEVVAVARGGGAEVDTHPDPDLTGFAPVGGGDGALAGEGGGDGLGALGKAAWTASPMALKRTPRWASIASRRRAKWRSTNACMATGSRSQRRVLPWMSVKREVTFPVG